MKIYRRLITAAVLLIIILSSCAEPAAPAEDAELLTYTISGSDTSLNVDVTYLDENNGIVKLSDQSLPWTVSIDLSGSTFTGEAYIKAEIPESEVFVALF